MRARDAVTKAFICSSALPLARRRLIPWRSTRTEEATMSKSTKEILAHLAAETKEVQDKQEADLEAARAAEKAQNEKAANAEKNANAFFALALGPLESIVNDFNEVNIKGATVGLLDVKKEGLPSRKYTGEFYGASAEFTWRAGIVIQFQTGNSTDTWRVGFTQAVDGKSKNIMVAACCKRTSIQEHTVSGVFDPSSEEGTAKWADHHLDEMLKQIKLH
jgi:hypothetical protein